MIEVNSDKHWQGGTEIKRIVLTLYCVFITLASVADAARFYRCVDSNGNVIMTDNPPQDVKCESRGGDNTVSESTQRKQIKAQKPSILPIPQPSTNTQNISGIGGDKYKVTMQECYESSILSPSPFMGNNGEIFKLADGSFWEVKHEYEYLHEYRPDVIICPSREKLIINGKSLDVQLVASVSSSSIGISGQGKGWDIFEETNLEGSISGTVQQGRIFKTTSGSIYEVTGLTLQLVLKLQPSVTVLRSGQTYKLIVEGFNEPLICRKLK